MNYKRKRIRAGISAYTMSKELGVDYEKYLKVEKKLIPLEGGLLNKFQDVLKNAKMIKFNHKQRMHEIHQFIKEGKMRDLMVKRGYNGVTLARVMNIAPSEISHVLNGKNNNEERVERVYDFLTNPINANVEGSDKQTEIEFDYKELEKIMRKKDLKRIVIAEALNIPYSSLCKYFSDKYKDSTSDMVRQHKKAIKEFIENYSPIETPIVKTPKQKHNSYQEEIEAIKQIKLESGDSYENIAKEIGVSQSHLSKVLTGNRKIAEDTAEKLRKYIDDYNKEEIAVEIPVAVPVEEEAEFEEFEEIVPISLGELEPIEIEPKNDKKGIDKCYYDIMAENFELKEELEKAKRQIRLYETLIEKIK
jgi:transcriptional regulator with XRE-family HTH domain